MLLGTALFLLTAGTGFAEDAAQSGPARGERVLPFTSNFVTGPHRGKQYCYVCELKDEPAVLVFARETDPATARLLRELRRATQSFAAQKLFGWFVFLAADDTAAETTLEQRAYELAREQGAAGLPVSVLGDPDGPPGYLISRKAAVTVLVFRKGKVLENRSFNTANWNDRAAGKALHGLRELIERSTAPTTSEKSRAP
jgi:hypothetical protein